MRLSFKRDLRDSGICFAWLPTLTDEGFVWLEHVHFHWVEGWGWGSDSYYEYRRLIPEHRYNGGERAQATFYQTPPGDPKKFCKNYRADGPTPFTIRIASGATSTVTSGALATT